MSRSVFIGTMLVLAPLADAQPSVSAPTDVAIPMNDKSVRVIDPAEFGQLPDANRFVPVPREQLAELLRLRHELALQPEPASPVRKAELSATLEGMTLRDGRLKLQLYPPSSAPRQHRPLRIAATNLQELELRSAGHPVVIASDHMGDLVILNNTADVLDGTWTAHGDMIGSDLVFQLALPSASVCQFVLTTDADVHVASPDALVLPKAGPQGKRSWELHPRSPDALTVKCSRDRSSDDNETTTIDTVASIRPGPHTADAEWVITLPSRLSGARMVLALNAPCTVTGVDLSTGRPLPFDAKSHPQGTDLRIQLPVLTASAVIKIQGRFATEIDTDARLPVLSPKTWITGSATNELALKSSSIRISVPPELDVRSLNLTGLRERDVAYQADGSQRLDLSQFSKTASADIRLSASRAVVNDAIFMQADSTEKEATAYVRVDVVSGFLSEVSWTTPASWRVTGVHEADSQRPLLFQMADEGVNGAPSRITAYLRAPLTSLPPDNSQILVINLQSTGSVFPRQWVAPRLQNPDYNRGPELQSIETQEADIPTISPEAAFLTADDVRNLLPWLPEQVLESVVNAQRTPSTSGPSPSLTSTIGPTSATIDYAVAMEQDSVRETLRVRLRSTDALPKRIPLRVTPGVDVQISDESVTQPVPSLTRQNSGGTEEIFLEIPAGVDTSNTLDILLVSLRPLAAEMPAALISLPDADHTVGALQPPLVESNLSISFTNDDVAGEVTEPIPYPTEPFANAITIRNLAERTSRQEVSGLAMALVERNHGGFTVEIAHRLLVRSVGNRDELIIQQPTTGLFIVFVDGRPAFPDQSQDRYRIALPTDREYAVVDVYLACELPNVQQETNVLHLPMLAFPATESGNVTCSILPPRQHTLTLANNAMCSDTRSADFISRTFTERYSLQTNPELSDRFRPMLTRCQLRKVGMNSVTVLESSLDSNNVELQFEETGGRVPQTIMLASVAFLIWLALRRMSPVPLWSIGVVLLAILAAYHMGGYSSTVVLNGLSIGTLCFAALSAGRRVRKRLHRGPVTGPPNSQFQSSTAVMLLCLTFASTPARADESREQILVPVQQEEAFPYIYVDSELLSQLNAVKMQMSTLAYVIQTDVSIEVEAADSVTATVQCLVASPPHSSSQLNIPFDGVTLVDCLLDGVRVFPSVEQTDNGQIEIPQRSLLPPSPLGSSETSPSTQGRDALGGWNLRTIRYSVRCTRKLLTATEFRISIPHSRSPVTRVSMSDPSQIVATASHGDAEKSGTSIREDDLISFPTVYNDERIIVDIALRSAAETAASTSQSVRVVCTADISHLNQRLSSEYSVTETGNRSTSVNLGVTPGHQITRIESLTGEELPWSINNGKLTVVVPANSEGLQQFIVQQVQESPISLHHSIPVGAIAMVNGHRAADVIIAAGTSDEFFISSIQAPDADLHEPEQNRIEQLPERLQNSQWIVAVPETTTRVNVELVARITAKEAELSQEVVVFDDRIEWKAQCRIQVLGNPTFRQTFIVSSDVRIEDVSASVGATARLQSWTRDKESVIVSFREATRGLVVVDFSGHVIREPGKPTVLPVFALPDSIATLESTLVISSTTSSDTFIKDLQSAVPLTRIDTARYVLSETPLQTDLTDDSRPPIIRPSEDQILRAEIVAVLHNAEGKTQITEFIYLEPQRSGFDIHCRPPAGLDVNNLTVAIDGQQVPVMQESGGIVIAREARGAPDTRTVLIVADVPTTARDGLLTAALPAFEADLKISSCEVYDARDLPSATEDSNNVPAWVAEAANTRGLSAFPPNLHKPRCDATVPENLITVYLSEQQRKAQPVEPVSGVAYVHALHDVQLGVATTIGRSEFMVFATHKDAMIEVDVPLRTRIVDVKHNGFPVPFSLTDNVIYLHGTAAVGRFEIQWRRQSETSMFQHEFLLPSVAAPDQRGLIRLAAIDETLWWSSSNKTEDLQQWQIDSQSSIAQGFSRIEQPAAVPETAVPENLPTIIAAPEWQQLVVASREAAESLLHTIANESAASEYRYFSTRLRPEIAVTLVPTPGRISLLVGICAIAMIAVPPGLRWRWNRARQQQSEPESRQTQQSDAS
jgi:hypothetical protein